jgi:uncharacterized protein YutE (UPF0331/DUF86 family)
MMLEAQFAESSVLQNLRQTYEARGLRFYVNPPRDLLPDFLGDYRPDAIAVGPEGGIIIEVKLRQTAESEKQLASISKRVSGQKGWEFRAIYVNPAIDQESPIAAPTPGQLQAAFSEIEVLMKSGHASLALVAAWATLESLARLAATDNEPEKLGRYSPIQAVQRLAEEGYVENDVAERLREMVKLRNAVVHGNYSVAVPAEQVQNLLVELRAIAANVVSVVRKPGV